MSDGIKADTVRGKIIIGVVVALLAGSSSPWWIEFFFGGNGGTNGGRSTQPPDPPQTSECVLTISNSLAKMYSERDRMSNVVSEVEPGEYNSQGYQNGWYKIRFEGREGWIPGDTWHIDSKSRACPP